MGLRGPGCSPGQPCFPFCDMGEAVGEYCLQGLLCARPSLCQALVTGRLILGEGPADCGHKGRGAQSPRDGQKRRLWRRGLRDAVPAGTRLLSSHLRRSRGVPSRRARPSPVASCSSTQLDGGHSPAEWYHPKSHCQPEMVGGPAALGLGPSWACSSEPPKLGMALDT